MGSAKLPVVTWPEQAKLVEQQPPRWPRSSRWQVLAVPNTMQQIGSFILVLAACIAGGLLVGALAMVASGDVEVSYGNTTHADSVPRSTR